MSPRRRLDETRKPQILAAAAQLLFEKGLSSVRIADVAQRAGTSATSVIYYFGNKADLFEEAIDSADEAFYAAQVADVERLEAGIDRLAWLVVSSSATDWLLWMDLWVYARRHPEMLAAQRRFDRRFRDMLADAIRHGEARGEFAPVDAEEAALRIGSLMRGLAIHVSLGEEEVRAAEMIDHCMQAAAFELDCDLEVLRAAAERQSAAADTALYAMGSPERAEER